MNPSSNRVGSSELGEIAYGVRLDSVVRLAVLSGESWKGVGVGVVAVVAADVAVAVAVLVVAPENSWSFLRYGWELVAYPGQQGSVGISNDTKRTPRREITERHRGKLRQPARLQSRPSGGHQVGAQFDRRRSAKANEVA